MRIVIGLLGVVLSLALVIYRVPVRNFIGQIQWAEDHLGPGGTYSMFVCSLYILLFLAREFKF